ncbi:MULTISPECIES: energy-coupling factor transporter transmembrane protein EcfT [unclassified Thermotoga]|uniref:energy-coupling factor transporter transmembrane protein EcfT n=1 Tax=unclassified Thermotoga TaxID=2631113 RepID=UPI000280E759|nr:MULTISPECIES: energy-coupling factor transporter transmembrane protein EcfT [unclassified Thermotoga]AIY86506.1 cobalt transport protein [Thermotoga sp. 2812B]EJX25947.1 cobalt transport protein [Thermotoga sp. EMP]
MRLPTVLIGRYIPVDSIVHRLDPRAKLLGMILLISAVLIVPDLLLYLVPGLAVFLLMFLSRTGFKVYLAGLRSLWFFLVFAVLVQFLSSSEGEKIFWIITDRAIWSAVYIMFRLVLIILLAENFSATTPPLLSARAIESIFSTFGARKIGHEIGMVMTIAMRFVPILALEADRILKAQIARGANFERGKFFDRIRALVVIIVPLLISALRKAEELAVAMEARLYTGEPPKTRFKDIKWKPMDTLYVLSTAGVLVLVLFGRYFVDGVFQYGG